MHQWQECALFWGFDWFHQLSVLKTVLNRFAMVYGACAALLVQDAAIYVSGHLSLSREMAFHILSFVTSPRHATAKCIKCKSRQWKFDKLGPKNVKLNTEPSRSYQILPDPTSSYFLKKSLAASSFQLFKYTRHYQTSFSALLRLPRYPSFHICLPAPCCTSSCLPCHNMHIASLITSASSNIKKRCSLFKSKAQRKETLQQLISSVCLCVCACAFWNEHENCHDHSIIIAAIIAAIIAPKFYKHGRQYHSPS